MKIINVRFVESGDLFLFRRLNDLIRLRRLSISHLLVLVVGGFLCHGSSTCSLGHLALLGCFGVGDGLGGGALFFNLVEVALYDGAGDGADLINLGDVDCLGGIFAFVVEPVLVLG